MINAPQWSVSAVGVYPVIDFPQHAETFKIEAADAQADLGSNSGANLDA